MKKTQNSQGFTIIELLIATTIFSVVLMIILASFLQIGRMFFKGVSVSNTQESARSIADNITNDLKLSQRFLPGNKDDPSLPPGTPRYFCIGLHRYVYNLNYKRVTAANVTNPVQYSPDPDDIRGVILSNVGTCQAPTPGDPGTNPQQLLGPDMQLNLLNVDCPSTIKPCVAHVHIIFYGFDDGVFTSAAYPNDPALSLKEADAYCSGELLGTQFCAASDIRANIALGY